MRTVAAGGRAPEGANGAARRRGTVLVMVVALLAMLFIVGVTFLNSVTFEGKAVADEKAARGRSVVIDRLSREVRAALRRSFLGDDGKAYNYELVGDTPVTPGGDGDGVLDAPSAIGDDVYGELPGVHPLLASIEPYDAGDPDIGSWYFYTASDLELALAQTPLDNAVTDVSGAHWAGVNLVYVTEALGVDHPHSAFALRNLFVDQEGETGEGTTKLRDPAVLYRRDADGDGVWDSYEYLLPLDRYPRSVRGDMPDKLRDEAAVVVNGDPNTDANALFYALRVLPHGAMVDVGHAHDTLLQTVLDHSFIPGGNDETLNVQGPYLSSGEEVVLRRRFLLPPPLLPLSSLQSHPMASGEIPEGLYRAFVPDNGWGGFLEGSTDPRWWPIDTGTNGDDIAAILPGTPDAPGWLDWVDPNSPKYDSRHLITTVSHDDNLMRMGRDVGSLDEDWIEAIVNSPNADKFAIDDWPDLRGDQGDPTNVTPLSGRLKVSLPGLVTRILVPVGPPLFGDGTVAGSFDDFEIDALSSPLLPAVVRERFLRTIQDGFALMLRNVDSFDNDTIAKTAAALTANLIDFADSDDVPTRVDARRPDTGDPILPTKSFYGLERQPFITEVYYDPGPPAAYAVELFNPYTSDDGNALDLSDYAFKNGSGTVFDLPSADSTMPSDSFLVFRGDVPVSQSDAPITGFQFTPQSTIQLIRTVAGVDVVVDEMQAPDGSQGAESNERFTSAAMRWLAPVPKINAGVVGGSLGGHTAAAIPLDIRPVEVRFANSGSMRAAFPTTGSLLLLSRYANTKTVPFTASLAGGAGMPPQEERIDNGRMPVFDVNQLAQGAGTAFSLEIPWGQLVFDYFTALPLSNDRTAGGDLEWPTVDQGGVRVHGRIDINAAPWSVLAGLPMVPGERLPAAFRNKIQTFVGLLDAEATPIGDRLAQSIVAYREARRIVSGPEQTADFDANRDRDGTGFLTVGELANVRGSGASNAEYGIDLDVIGSDNEDYVQAVAVLVALEDWVTTRSHVFTVYGTLRGAGEKGAVDRKALRFQETVDRLPSLFNKGLPVRVGPRVTGKYAQASDN